MTQALFLCKMGSTSTKGSNTMSIKNLEVIVTMDSGLKIKMEGGNVGAITDTIKKIDNEKSQERWAPLTSFDQLVAGTVVMSMIPGAGGFTTTWGKAHTIGVVESVEHSISVAGTRFARITKENADPQIDEMGAMTFLEDELVDGQFEYLVK